MTWLDKHVRRATRHSVRIPDRGTWSWRARHCVAGAVKPRSREFATLAAVVLIFCGEPAVSSAQPPLPRQLAIDFQARCPQLSGAAASLDALTELFNRMQGLPNWEPLKATAAAAELRTFISLARRGAEIELVPSRAGAVSSDAVIRISERGVVREMRVEIKSVTGRHFGIKPRGGFGKNYRPRSAGVKDIMRALRSGYRGRPGALSQLGAPMTIGERLILPGGKLIIQLPRDTNSPTAVQDAMRKLRGQMHREGRHVHEVEFHRRDRTTGQWTFERYVRRPDGSYGRVAPEQPKHPVAPCPDRRNPPQAQQPAQPVQPPPRGPAPAQAAPTAAVRSAIAATVTQVPADKPPDLPPAPGGGGSGQIPAPVLAPQGGGKMTSTGSLSDRNLGGVDFSSLELRYVSDVSTSDTRAAGFAFKASPGSSAGGGIVAAQRASEAFFVWLALPPSSFTVNLNPDSPTSIIDAKFGQTNAGRVLLEADLRMKKTAGQLIHPDTRLGRRYWTEMGRINGDQPSCLSFRQWIAPAPAIVHETDDELYILKAPLSVKLEGDYLRARGIAGAQDARCAGQGTLRKARSEALYRRLILPRVQRAVNRASQYAALRRVYFSRVAAEWYRQRGTRHAGAYAAIINSGHVTPWAQKGSWTPRDVFDRYVRSVTEGEFNVRRRWREGNWIVDRTYIYGGVDFRHIPRKNVSSSALQGSWPSMRQQITGALSRPRRELASGDVWLGGASFDRAAALKDPVFNPAAKRGPSPLLIVALAAIALALAVRLTSAVLRRPSRTASW